MTQIKKYLDEFYWYDCTVEEFEKSCPRAKLPIEYPSTYQIYFGVLPVNFLKINQKILPKKNFRKFENYVLGEGFKMIERGNLSFRYIHPERKISINGEVSEETIAESEEEKEYYDGAEMAPLTSSSGDEEFFISVLPTKENRIFMEKFIKKITNSFMIDLAKDESKFYMIAQNNRGLFSQRTNFKSIPIKDERFDMFYGKDFPHEKLKKFVTEETENLMLLHGDPGTGKSNYIKHIITNSKKKVIYIPPSMLSVISTPGFISYVMENKNSIILIEDAEEVLSVDRNSATNNLLGLTDGFLKDALNLKIICTFNCPIAKIDPALMRKGRMYFEYKFDKLTVDECRELSKFLNFERHVTEPMTLAEFFIKEDNHIKNSFEERTIGFLG